LKEFHVDNPSAYFTDYVKRTTDMPMLVMLDKIVGNDFGRGSKATAAGTAGEPQGGGEQQGKSTYSQGRFLRAADLVNNLGEDNNPDWKTIAINSDGRLTSPNGAIGYRWGQAGKWNLEQKDKDGDIDLQLTLKDSYDELADVAFPYFGGAPHEY